MSINLRGFDYEGDEKAADITDIREIERSFGSPLPSDYLEILTKLDGYEGNIDRPGSEHPAYLLFYPANKVLENNRSYEVTEHEPTLLLVGSDGGGEAILLRRPDQQSGKAEWVMLPFMDIGDFDPGTRIERRFPTLNAVLESIIASW